MSTEERIKEEKMKNEQETFETSNQQPMPSIWYT